MTFPICTYEPAKNVFVSKYFTRDGYMAYWERQIVDRFNRLLRRQLSQVTTYIYLYDAFMIDHRD